MTPMTATPRGVRTALEVVEPLELAEHVVERLLAHAEPSGELTRPGALGAGVLEQVEVRGVQIVEAVRVQPLQHVALHRLPRHAQECADQRRPEGTLRRFRKVT
jgi:hypothetical protein